MKEADRMTTNIEEDEALGGAGEDDGSGGGSDGSGTKRGCEDPGFAAADMSAASPTCSAAEIRAAKSKATTALKDYLAHYVEAEDGKYSKDGTGFKNIYEKEKKKKFLKDKPLGE